MAQQAAWSKAPTDDDGRFRRKSSEFRDAITSDGQFAPEAGRYHLYVQYACPWAHRTLLTRTLLGLDDAVSVDVVDWRMQDDGSWVFNADEPGATADSVAGAHSLQDIYHAADPDFSAIGTVPVLWDKEHSTIVNNESREIVRMLDTVLAPALGASGVADTLLPPGLAAEVDAMIDANHSTVNNGVYKAGFARTQRAYDEAVAALFDRLAELEAHMQGRDWLVGKGRGTLTEADVCLWPTLLRFDAVYHTHFKCNQARIKDHPNLWAFVKRLYHLPGVAATVEWRHIKNHYYGSHTHLNPHGIVAAGPDMQAELAA